MENTQESNPKPEVKDKDWRLEQQDFDKRTEKQGHMKYNYVSVSPERRKQSDSPTIERIKNIQNLGRNWICYHFCRKEKLERNISPNDRPSVG